MNPRGFCIFIDTVFEGSVPSCYDGGGKPVIFPTRLEAQRELVDNLMMRFQQFLDGERDFDDAMTVEEYIVEVGVFPDGSIMTADGEMYWKHE